MNKSGYIIKLEGICENPAFHDASKQELGCLVALIAKNGQIESKEALAEVAATTPARAAAALSLWQESGVIIPLGEGAVVDEFSDSEKRRRPDETLSEDTARDIRNEGLKTLIEEVATIIGKPALNTQEIKQVTALYTECGVSVEYIMSLAAYLGEKGKLTAIKLLRKGEELVGKSIDSLEELERYISEAESVSAMEREIRRIFCIYDRRPTKSEKKYFARWTDELGFSLAIIGEAYDIAVSATGSRSLPYIDAVLTAWHNAKCRTVDECIAYNEQFRKEQAEKQAAGKKKSEKKTEAKSPKFTEYDSDDALMRALERSYGTDNKK